MIKAIVRTLFRNTAWAVALFITITLLLLSYNSSTIYNLTHTNKAHLFDVQAVDTMKYSRDIAGQVLDNPKKFTALIDTQMQRIAEAGATHAAIATPYDAKFLPVLELWVASARAHGLKVWFRGNFAGWEGWFGFAKIDRVAHKKLLQAFISGNPGLFAEGDVFTPCPECENGGPGDPRLTGDASGYNTFLRDERKLAESEFIRQGKKVAIYPSMNGDIARDIITPSTVKAFGGTILVDHYVRSASQFGNDLEAMSDELNAKIGLGEFGAPIPDLNGTMTEKQQAAYVGALLEAMVRAETPVVNYWTLTGGSTALLNDNGTSRAAYTTLQNYFKAYNVVGVVYDSLGEPLHGASVRVPESEYRVVANYASYQIFVPRQYREIVVEAEGYKPATITLPSDPSTVVIKQDFYLTPTNPDWEYRLRTYFHNLSSYTQ